VTKAARHLVVGLLMAGLAAAGRPTFAAAPDQPHSDRVRSDNANITLLIQQAWERSKIFRGLIDTISASDAIVFIHEGNCGHGMRACFVTVTKAGPNRMLWVKVDVRGIDCDLMGAIGHELQHTVEVLGDPTVRNGTGLYFFYQQYRDRRGGGSAFETDTAIKIGEAVRAEVRQKGPCGRVR
jgi:hypothetical protein